MPIKNWLFISVAANLIFLIMIYVAFFSTFTVPARWKNSDLHGKSPEHIHSFLGQPDVNDAAGKGMDMWFLENAPYWILRIGYNKEGEATSAYVFRVYFKSIYPKTGSIVRLW